MHDSERDSTEAGERPADGPPYLPYGAYGLPSLLAPQKPTWARAYALPSARGVVSAGLQLAVASSVPIREASIYIGLLFLGAFGPAAILLLIGMGRLLGDPASAAILSGRNPFLVFENPALGGPTTLISLVAAIGAVLLVAISIDAKAIALAILGGAAAEQPMRLSEAIDRARQTFWRLLGAGLLVGLASFVITLVVAWPFLRPFESNSGVNFVASMIASLVLSPFVFSSAGIVLGDVGVTESLRRSVRLFRAQPRIGIVVTLFSLVSAAIQQFALGAGADLVGRVAGFFHVGEGAASLILPGILVLVFIVALGSLTFTIAAIVAAPQVAAFLGLTFYSAGLDEARAPAGAAAPPARWLSLPMGIVMAFLGFVVVIGVLALASVRLS